MSFQPTVAAFNKLLGEFGLSLPDGVTEETFDSAVAEAMDEFEQQTATAESSSGSRGDSSAVVRFPANLPAELGQTIESLVERVHDLSLQVTALRSEGARTAFTNKLQSLASTGRINARTVSSMTQTGEAHGWDLSLLAPFDDLQMVDLGRRSKPLGNSQPPAVEGVTGDLTPEEIAAAAALIGGSPRPR
jgi:hypothetical protein